VDTEGQLGVVKAGKARCPCAACGVVLDNRRLCAAYVVRRPWGCPPRYNAGLIDMSFADLDFELRWGEAPWAL
jgi:hypothetical protein